jgi:hypothetical protein
MALFLPSLVGTSGLARLQIQVHAVEPATMSTQGRISVSIEASTIVLDHVALEVGSLPRAERGDPGLAPTASSCVFMKEEWAEAVVQGRSVVTFAGLETRPDGCGWNSSEAASRQDSDQVRFAGVDEPPSMLWRRSSDEGNGPVEPPPSGMDHWHTVTSNNTSPRLCFRELAIKVQCLRKRG